MKNIGTYAKAIVGFVAPGLVTLGAALTNASDGGKAITQTEWLGALIACVVTAAGVYAVKNTPQNPEA